MGHPTGGAVSFLLMDQEVDCVIVTLTQWVGIVSP